MSENNLPIQFFAHREVDIQKPEGGGNGDFPKFVLHDEELEERIEYLSDSMESIISKMEQKNEYDMLIPTVIKARYCSDAKAKSHRAKMSGLFRVGITENIIGMAENDEIIIKLNSLKEAKAISSRLKDSHRYQHAISCIDSIEEFKPYLHLDNTTNEIDYKVKLIDFNNYEQNISIMKYFETKVSKFEINFSKTLYANDYVIYNLKNIGEYQINLIKSDNIFDSIFEIQPMPKFSVILDSLEKGVDIEIKYPIKDKEYAVVGVLDSGISRTPHLSPWVLEESHSSYPKEYRNEQHGTFVSGIVTYGDELENENWVGGEGVKVLDACIFPDTKKETIPEDQLVNNINEAVAKYCHKVKVWNLSISINNEISEYDFSDFAIALDSIQEEYDVIICKSAGNCSNFTKGLPKGKLHHGADSVRALTCGSIAQSRQGFDMVNANNPSPFSRIGRGPSYIIKPELVHYGGNAGIAPNGEVKINGVKSFSVNGELATAAGTSFSTPRLAALTAQVQQEIAEEFDPLLVKGLVVHSAQYTKELELPKYERVNQVGFGVPKRIEEILYNNPHEVTLILRDELAKNEYIDIMDFPMPECMVEDGFYNAQILVTLIYNPILKPNQRSEYCQSDIDIKMGTYDKKFERDLNSRNILNPIGRRGAKNILREEFYSKRKMRKKEDDFALKEKLLIKYADKYYPVKKYAIDLTDVTDGNRVQYLSEDKKWYLYLKGLYRDSIETEASINGLDLKQEFCLIITIKDPNNSKEVYTKTFQKLDDLNFWHNNLKTRSEVRVENR